VLRFTQQMSCIYCSGVLTEFGVFGTLFVAPQYEGWREDHEKGVVEEGRKSILNAIYLR
jgi:hypothetical protein